MGNPLLPPRIQDLVPISYLIPKTSHLLVKKVVHETVLT